MKICEILQEFLNKHKFQGNRSVLKVMRPIMSRVLIEVQTRIHINIILMPKGQRKQLVHCSEHYFSLKPLRHGLHYKDTVAVSFCKGKLQPKPKTKKSLAEQTCLCCPVFNKDRSHATSTFILPEEQVLMSLTKKNFLENSEKFKQEHDGKIEDYNCEKTEIVLFDSLS